MLPNDMADGGAAAARVRELRLPISRVKTIMKSSPNVDTVGAEPLFLVTKVTELFIAELARTAYARASGMLDYKHIAEVVQTDDTLDFLREIMPRKMTVREYRRLMAAKALRGDGSDLDSSTDTSSSGDSDSSASTSPPPSPSPAPSVT